MQKQGISKKALIESVKRDAQDQLPTASPQEIERYAHSAWTSKAQEILEDPDLTKKFAVYSQQLDAYNAQRGASQNSKGAPAQQSQETKDSNATPETKPDTASNQPPPQKTQAEQPGRKQMWNPATKSWEPVSKTASGSTPAPEFDVKVKMSAPAVPQEGAGRNPYAPPAETSPTQEGKTLAEIARERTSVALKMERLKEVLGQYDQQARTQTNPAVQKNLRASAAKLRAEYVQLEKEIQKIDAARGDATPPKTGAPKTAAEVAARARNLEMVTVRKGEGAWQAVRRQFYERMRADMTPEQAAKLPPDLERLGKGSKLAKILDRETLTTLKKAGYINPDGTTKLGITKPGVRIVLNPDNSIGLQGEGKMTYEPTGQRPKAGATPERAGRARGGTAADQTGRARRGGEYPQERGTARQSVDLNKETLQEIKPRLEDTGGGTTPEANLKSNLKEFGLKPQEFKNISEMKTKAFIDEMGRHDTEIREAIRRGARDTTGIFINRGPFTTRGFNADMTEARKYLDLSERLEKYLKPLGRTARRAILDKPMGDILRSLSFEK